MKNMVRLSIALSLPLVLLACSVKEPPGMPLSQPSPPHPGVAETEPGPTDLAPPEGLPRRGDVILRTLFVTESSDRRMGTLDAAQRFGANRVEWIYEVDEDFIQRAHAKGIRVGATMNLNAWPYVQKVPDFIEKFTARDLDGQPVTLHWFTWPNAEVTHFMPDIHQPGWLDFYTEYVSQWVRRPITALMRDDQSANLSLIGSGGTYTEASVEQFRRYLADEVSKEERERLGITDPASFDIREYLRARGAPPPGSGWSRWDGGPVFRLYARMQMLSSAAFFSELRQRVENETGRRIPWACNHVGSWGPIERNFDYALGEFYRHQIQMETMVELARRARRLGKIQGLQGVVDREWEKRDAGIRTDEMRLAFASAYALGMLPMVPWDMYMPGNAPRYFGSPEDYAELFQWVRAHHDLFDDYATAQITAFDPLSSRQECRSNQQVVQFDEVQTPLLRINAENILGVVRRHEEASPGRHVIHLVDWNRERRAFTITLDLKELSGSIAARVHLLRPGHAPLLLGEGHAASFEIPALDPWGLLQIESMENVEGGQLAPPVLVEPRTPVVARGSRLSLASDHLSYVRMVSPHQTDWQRIDERVVIDQDAVWEARSRDEQTERTSPVVHWKFWIYDQYAVDKWPAGAGQSILADLSASASGRVAIGVFEDGEPARHEGRTPESFLASIGDTALRAPLPVGAAYFEMDLAVADDTEMLRPSFRVTVYADAERIYETPIYNTVKYLVHHQEDSLRKIRLALPEGAGEIMLQLHGTGWFPEHNRILWINPVVYVLDGTPGY